MGERRKVVALFLIVLIFLVAACSESKPLPEETLPPAPGESATKIEKANITFLPEDMFPQLNKELPYSELIPEIDALKVVDFFTPVDVVTNDLNVAGLSQSERNEILSTIRGKRELIYINPGETDVIVFYTIYEFNSSKYAEKVLEIYKDNWNKDNITVNNITMHIWKGYALELVRNAPALESGVIVYYDPAIKKAFLSKSLRQLPALARIGKNLYSMHGETAIGKYFFMVDIKSEHLNIENKSAAIFGDFVKGINITKILNESVEEERKKEQKNIYEERIKELKTELSALLESYLAGNITKEEYLERQTNITAEIDKLRELERSGNQSIENQSVVISDENETEIKSP